MAWQPAPEALGTLATCLKDSLSGFNPAAQKQAESVLAQAKSTLPDFNNYLAYFLSHPNPPNGLTLSQRDYHQVRSGAVVMLKNNVRSSFKSIPEASMNLVKAAILLGLQDQNAQIRSYTGNVITELVNRVGVYGWPEILPQLLKMISNEDGTVSAEGQEGAMLALSKICEDNTKMLERVHNGQRPLSFILPKLIQATKSTTPRIRANALVAINVFVPRKSQPVLDSLDDLVAAVFALAHDTSNDVRRQVCKCLVMLVEARSDKVQPHISELVDYMLAQQKSDDEELAVDAAEFWLAIGEHEDLWKSLTPYISKIIPVLLECMVYSGEDIALLGGASDDEDEEDREEDIKPQFAKKSSARTTNAEGADMTINGNAYEKLESMDDDELEEGEIEDSDAEDGDENPDERWTVRKCSAATLDVFARDFKDPVFECTLPVLSTNLKHEDWPHREAAVLALGAIQGGCMEAVTPHLPSLIPYLVTLLDDPEPVVRQITCWTLGRYSQWAARLSDPTQRQTFFVPIMEGILKKMLDKNKKVQEAGASAMANLEEKAGKALEPYCAPILQQFVTCFGKYKDRNMFILYDCVQTLAEAVGPVLAAPELSSLLMPALVSRWEKVVDQSREIFPLLECFSYVAVALRDAFSPYAVTTFRRCVKLIHQNLEQSMASASNTAIDKPDKDFVVTSLDLLSAIIQALEGKKADELVQDSQPAFFELLTLCISDISDEVKQSAYALLGDCARFVFPQLRPYLPSIFPILINQLDLDSVLDEEIEGSFSVVNNACWSAGEIAVQHGAEMAPFVPGLTERCIEIIQNPNIPKSVVENAAIAMGRLGLANAEMLAPKLPDFAEAFLSSMEEIDPTDEKASAFQGFSLVVGRNPAAMEKVLLQYFVAIARYPVDYPNDVSVGLQDVFQKVITVYQQMIPGFDNFLSQLLPQDREALRARYKV